MDLKKVIIAVILLLIVLVGGFLLMSSQSGQVIKYDEHFNLTLPADFNTTEVNGSVTSAFPENKSYIIQVNEDKDYNVDNIGPDFKMVQEAVNLTDLKQYYTNVSVHNVGNNKVYEYTTTDADVLKQQGYDARMARELSIAVPNSKKIYNLIFLTNDTSVDLRNSDIESIINSTAQIE